MTNNTIREVLAPIAADIQHSWSVIMYDAGPCDAFERAELALDRLDGEAGDIVDAAVAQFGYNAVEQYVARNLL